MSQFKYKIGDEFPWYSDIVCIIALPDGVYPFAEAYYVQYASDGSEGLIYEEELEAGKVNERSFERE